MARRTGWVPNQHGAWAMLVVPFVAGVILRARDAALAPYLASLFVFWMLGYFAFFAASVWLKAPARRRPRLVPPLVTWTVLAAVAGVVTLLLAGPGILGWVPFYLPLLLPALWLAAQRRERATIGGALTIAAASLMGLVARYTAPADLLADPDAARPLLVVSLLFAYFFGTVLYVKTNIRERGNPRFLAASVAWHAGFTLVATVLAAVASQPLWWAVFFAATTVRAFVVPRLVPAPSAARIGFLEVAFSAAALLGIALA